METIALLGEFLQVIVIPLLAIFLGYIEKSRIDREKERKASDALLVEQLNDSRDEQKRQREFLIAQQEGTMALIRESIVGIHKESVKRGYMDMHQRESLNKLYSAYKGMNGNGMVDTLYAEMSDPDIVTTRVVS